MLVNILLPAEYQLFKGKRKKYYAWAYLQRNYSEYVPDHEQPLLESDNILLCTLDFEKARQEVKELQERQAEKKRKKR